MRATPPTSRPHAVTVAVLSLLLAIGGCGGDSAPDTAGVADADTADSGPSTPDGCEGSCDSSGSPDAPLDGDSTQDAADGTSPPDVTPFAPDLPCTPDCAGLACGPDHCGGSCGTCADGDCVAGVCTTACEEECPADDAVTCDGDAVRRCGQHDADPCHEWGPPESCGPAHTCEGGLCVCQPDCTGAQCGDDGCGGSCGDCDPAKVCIGGACIEVCSDECPAAGQLGCVGDSVRECGDFDDDGCLDWSPGAPCGAGMTCVGGACVCAPDCAGKECGDDGCDGSCGGCAPETLCTDGLCMGPCADDCETPGESVCEGNGTRSCGQHDADPCLDWSEVASCKSNEVCTDGVCVCQPSCEGKECGTDGCGGPCGAPCGEDLGCTSAGKCTPTEAQAMLPVPAGPFFMGCNAASGDTCYPEEEPQHEVILPAYLIDRTEVSVGAYAVCSSAGGCAKATTPIPACTFGEGAEKPLNCVNWTAASSYCAWVGKRLCTEAEWEKAAKGGCELHPGEPCAAAMPTYPWGEAPPTCELAVMNEKNSYGCGKDSPANVGSLTGGASPYGALDMAGNLSEWVADYYAGDYYCKGPAATCKVACAACEGESPYLSPWTSPKGPPQLPGGGALRVIRGGGYLNGGPLEAEWLRASYRASQPPGLTHQNVGFRCCRTAPAP